MHNAFGIISSAGKIGKQKGLVNFIININKLRNNNNSHSFAQKADDEMLRNGIVAVYDIANTSDSFRIKTSSRIKYFTFIEIFGIQNKEAEEKLRSGIECYQNWNYLA